MKSSLAAIRSTQPYRTIPHEIGHIVACATKVSNTVSRRLELDEDYSRRPSQERESLAHCYADEFHSRMFSNSALSFPRPL